MGSFPNLGGCKIVQCTASDMETGLQSWRTTPQQSPVTRGFDTPAVHTQNWTRAWLLQFYASQPGVRDPQTQEVWEQLAQAQLPPRAQDFARKALWHKLTVHARVYKRSGTDKCPVCSQKETVKHAMVECPMVKAATMAR